MKGKVLLLLAIVLAFSASVYAQRTTVTDVLQLPSSNGKKVSSIMTDTTLTGATDAMLVSALAVKKYVDAHAGSGSITQPVIYSVGLGSPLPTQPVPAGSAAIQVVDVNGNKALHLSNGVSWVSVGELLGVKNVDSLNISPGEVKLVHIGRNGASSGQVLKWNGTAWAPSADATAPTGTAGGDLDSNYPNPTVVAIQGHPLSDAIPLPGQTLIWDGGSWNPTLPPGAAYEYAEGDCLAPSVVPDPIVGPFLAWNTDCLEQWRWNGVEWVIDGSPTGTFYTSGQFSGNGESGTPLTLAQNGASTGQVMKWNGTVWAPGTDVSGGGGSQTLQQVLTTGATLTQANTINNSVGQLSVTGRSVRLDTLVNGSGVPKYSALQTFRHSGIGGLLQSIVTTQGDTVTGTRPYGNYYSTIDNSYLNSDGQRDAVWHFGYNSNGGGGKVNPNEAEVHWAIESHYIGGGTSPTGDFEVHLESTAKNGNKNRHMSYNIQKATGLAKVFNAVDYVDYRSTGTGLPYFILERDNSAGTAQFRVLTGTSPSTNSEFRVNGTTSGSQTDFGFVFTGATNKFLTFSGINTIVYGGISGTFRQFSGQPMIYQSNTSSGVQHMFNNSIGSTTIPILQVKNESTGQVSFNVHGNNRVTIGKYISTPTSTLEVIASVSEGSTQPLVKIENSTGGNNFYRSTASPLSVITANPGDLALVNDGTNGALYGKYSNTNTIGWGKYLNLIDPLGASLYQSLRWNGSSWVPIDDYESIALTVSGPTVDFTATGPIPDGYWRVPSVYNGWKLEGYTVSLATAGSGAGSLTVQVQRTTLAGSASSGCSTSFSAGDLQKDVTGCGLTLATGDMLRLNIGTNDLATPAKGVVVTYILKP